MPDYGIVIVDEDGEDAGDIIDLTDELRSNPQKLMEVINKGISDWEAKLEADLEDEEEDE